MKKIALLLLLLCSLSGFSQANSFIISNEKLIWENVFISEETNIPAIISRHVRLKITSSEGGVYKGTGTELKNTCPGTSDFLKDDFSFDFEIELREGKYRVTISNLIFLKKTAKKKHAQPMGAEKFLTDKGVIKSGGKSDADLLCLDNYFNKIFSMTTAYKNRQ
ncbi:hypothetical protein FMM05_11285 [Flavobacterium zepuense]|uniref:DUF4468 domain-containing protein n=1 Tax=Flavobacterium zepuense TaxID=2593302 RepID=A0A552V1T7_9FLAO|nr:hypothetical protein [Flavobacterium zepuense]TRW24408.1 hypothetical protein FMM05_11285 [Flavobacterium zepuense]